jgi:AraC family transcriptional activator of pobA
MEITSLEEFYKQTASLIPDGIDKEIGHFNIFKVDDIVAKYKKKPFMPYNRRAYYKISVVSGRNKALYADKEIDIEKNALLFATPKIPYHWVPQDDNQFGYFCIFTHDFLIQNKSGVVLDELPIFQPGGYPIFQLTDEEAEDITLIFKKMYKEISSDYAYKYDLLRN